MRILRYLVVLSVVLAPWTAALAGAAIDPSGSAQPPAPPPGFVLPPPAKDPKAPCTCATTKDTNGWCDRHGYGYVASVKIVSKPLWETLDAHGHTLDFSTFQCSTCQKAIASNGFCEEHRVGFVAKLAYFSRLTYELACAEAVDPTKIKCSTCRRNARSLGWCEKCRVGMVGNLRIKDPERYQHASNAVAILHLANKAAERCANCAAAIVTDTECPFCRITYKDGRAVSQ